MVKIIIIIIAIVISAAAAAAVNFRGIFEDDDIKIKPKRTAAAVIIVFAAIFGGITIHCKAFKIAVPEKYEGLVAQEILESARETIITYGKKSGTFPLRAEVKGANESGAYAIEAVYFVYGRALGIAYDGENDHFLYEP